MGVIDSKIFNLTCPHCNENEEQTVLDKGSGWNGSSWAYNVFFSKFDVAYKGGGQDDPEILSAKCKKCGCEDINIEYEYKV